MYGDEKLAIEPSGPPFTLPPVAAPAEIDWSALSFRSREIISQVALRLTAGYSLDEIAEQLSDARPSLRYVELPKGDVTKSWCSARLRELQHEIEEMSAPVA